MATDGHRVYALFASGDIAGFDFEGQRLWHVALGLPDSAYAMPVPWRPINSV